MKTIVSMAAAGSLALGSALLAQEEPPPVPGPTHVAPAPAREQGTVGQIWIGIDASPLSPALAHQLRLKPGVGLIVDRVTYDSPAARAGIKEFDVLQKVDDHVIDDPGHFVSLFVTRHPGDVVSFALIREGQPIEAKVTLGKQDVPPPTGDDMPPEPRAIAPAPRHHSRGLRLPKINVRIDERGDLVATDGSGHTLLRQPLDFTIDTPELPFSIHIEPKPGKPLQPPADSPER